MSDPEIELSPVMWCAILGVPARSDDEHNSDDPITYTEFATRYKVS